VWWTAPGDDSYAATHRGAGPAGGPNALRHFDQSLAAVKNTPLQPAQKLEVLFAVDDYVFGHALRRRELADHTDDSPEWAFALIQAGGYPELRALLGDDFEQALATWEAILGELDADRAFETGLAALLDGLALRFGLEEPAGAPSGDDAPA